MGSQEELQTQRGLIWREDHRGGVRGWDCARPPALPAVCFGASHSLLPSFRVSTTTGAITQDKPHEARVRVNGNFLYIVKLYISYQ